MKNKEKKPASFESEPSLTLAHPRQAVEKQQKPANPAVVKRRAAARKRARAKRARLAAQPTAAEARKTVTDRGGVTRVVDSIEQMFRAGQIDGRQRQAAERVRDAAALVSGSVPCALDATRVKGGGAASPTDAQLAAGRVLAHAARLLGRIDYGIVCLVCCDGHSVRDVAAGFFGPAGEKKTTDREAKHIGMRLRMALELLADAWIPRPRSQMRRSGVTADVFIPQDGENYSVERGRVIHATGWRFFEV